VIFGDSSFFVGLVDSKDQWHSRAAKLVDVLPKDIIVSDLVVAECVTIVSSRSGGRAALILYQYFRDSCLVEFLDSGLLDEAMASHLRYDGKLSLADCVSLTIMSRRKVSRIVSFDSDFDRVKGLERIS
jgi:hypothetical protein